MKNVNFAKEHKTADKNLNSETESLLKIKEQMNTKMSYIWRYATETGEEQDSSLFESG